MPLFPSRCPILSLYAFVMVPQPYKSLTRYSLSNSLMSSILCSFFSSSLIMPNELALEEDRLAGDYF